MAADRVLASRDWATELDLIRGRLSLRPALLLLLGFIVGFDSTAFVTRFSPALLLGFIFGFDLTAFVARFSSSTSNSMICAFSFPLSLFPSFFSFRLVWISDGEERRGERILLGGDAYLLNRKYLSIIFFYFFSFLFRSFFFQFFLGWSDLI